jgi:hypothetical protein
MNGIDPTDFFRGFGGGDVEVDHHRLLPAGPPSGTARQLPTSDRQRYAEQPLRSDENFFVNFPFGLLIVPVASITPVRLSRR